MDKPRDAKDGFVIENWPAPEIFASTVVDARLDAGCVKLTLGSWQTSFCLGRGEEKLAVCARVVLSPYGAEQLLELLQRTKQAQVAMNAAPDSAPLQ